MSDEEGKTVFNSAIMSLERIHNILIHCTIASNECIIYGANTSALKRWEEQLQSLYTELECKCSEKHIERINNEFNKYENLLPLFKYTRTEYEGIAQSINLVCFRRRMNQLRKVERILRKIADDRGMLIPEGSGKFGALE